ncbi:EAL domain-containing protein [Paenibacillus melissococcoides]|uniref:EAL domain-containing protein n=1 Tax=Paenibacillus melissococcoides TaxID=2912268 RepID=A0ABM9G0M0_9BACL|nr:EAL domain-containing protein [Paenibacillus melissococcoides]MEB9896515.1 EAL domain-containing protein [Bacillus cereus]CAH8245013.1 EAL domain-containing protein [Paenibacillus melissococcoides]CAH8709643.1 EAL domain-containing protein [Paenibacillus melissococcoides]CAH8710369.1 EAL domain-containing protein [Paenibacillus melissococcoides]
MPYTSVLPNSSRTGLAYISLILLGVIGSQIEIKFPFGVEFALSGAFFLVALVLFGAVRTMAFAGLAALILYFAGYSVDMLAFIGLELAVVGFLCRRRRRLLFWDSLFWLAVGAPAFVLLFLARTGVFGTEAMLQYLMFAVNGIANALLADMLLAYVPWQRLLARRADRPISLHRVIVHLALCAVLLSFLAQMRLGSAGVLTEVEREAYAHLEEQSIRAEEALREVEGANRRHPWSVPDVWANVSLAENLLKEESLEGVLKFALSDERGNMFAWSDRMWAESRQQLFAEAGVVRTDLPLPKTLTSGDGVERSRVAGFYRVLPGAKQYPYGTCRWRDGYYVLERYGEAGRAGAVTAFLPNDTFLPTIFHFYVRELALMLAVWGIVSGIAVTASRSLVRSLDGLNRMTSVDPAGTDWERQAWPHSRVREIRSLMLNFRAMAERVAAQFRELHRMNEHLVQQTKLLEKSEEHLQRLAYYDPLTKLPNRHYFTIEMDKALERAEVDAAPLALLFIDLDRFKHINDSLGHKVGDMLLVRAGQRLLHCLSKPEGAHLCARLGGDEFVILLEKGTREEAKKLAQRILQHFRERFCIQAHELFVSASIGIALYPDDGNTLTALFKQADTAMYAAKERGGQSYMFFDQIHPDLASGRMLLESLLYRAMERDELTLHYQPIVDRAGKVVAAEVLLRWLHPQQGYISPSQFIPVAEETGLVIPIGEWVLRSACMQHRQWREQGMPPLRLSVNVSLRQFLNQDFVAMVERIVQETRFEPEQLVLEITEGYVHKHVGQANHVLRQLNRRGMNIAIDDFGTGYSSLERLKTLPVHTLKIDRSFVRHLSADPVNASIVQAVIQLGHSLNLTVIAEGVETAEEFHYLEALGCNHFQGYYISHPLPAEEFAARFRQFSHYADGRASAEAAGGEA